MLNRSLVLVREDNPVKFSKTWNFWEYKRPVVLFSCNWIAFHSKFSQSLTIISNLVHHIPIWDPIMREIKISYFFFPYKVSNGSDKVIVKIKLD